MATWLCFRFRRERALSILRLSTRPATLRAPSAAARVPWAIDAVGRRLALTRNCLLQAVVAQALLQRHGCTSRLVVGVKRGVNGGLIAHAWVEDPAGHRVVGGSVAARYTPLANAHEYTS